MNVLESSKRERERERERELEKKRELARMFLNVREKKKIKEQVGGIEIGWTHVWRRKTRKKKMKKRNENIWMRMN